MYVSQAWVETVKQSRKLRIRERNYKLAIAVDDGEPLIVPVKLSGRSIKRSTLIDLVTVQLRAEGLAWTAIESVYVQLSFGDVILHCDELQVKGGAA